MSQVELISYTPNAEKLIASCAKLCYSDSSIKDIMSNQINDNKIQSFIKMLSEIGHESPIEHVSFTFGIEDVSRALLAQITRHRIASFSVQSQRYVSEENFKYVIPYEIENLEEAKKEYEKAMEESNEHYKKLKYILYNKHKETFLEQGKDLKTAEKLSKKKAIEDARFVLPNACTTKIIVTMNARSLLHFFSLRCCNRAQWEIREVAIKMLKLVLNVAPNIFATAGPGCLKGKCPEGKMTCGKHEEVKKKFLKIKNGVKNAC